MYLSALDIFLRGIDESILHLGTIRTKCSFRPEVIMLQDTGTYLLKVPSDSLFSIRIHR